MSLALKRTMADMSPYGCNPFGVDDGQTYLVFMIRAYLYRRHDENFDEIDRKTLKFMISELRTLLKGEKGANNDLE